MNDVTHSRSTVGAESAVDVIKLFLEEIPIGFPQY